MLGIPVALETFIASKEVLVRRPAPPGIRPFLENKRSIQFFLLPTLPRRCHLLVYLCEVQLACWLRLAMLLGRCHLLVLLCEVQLTCWQLLANSNSN